MEINFVHILRILFRGCLLFILGFFSAFLYDLCTRKKLEGKKSVTNDKSLEEIGE